MGCANAMKFANLVNRSTTTIMISLLVDLGCDILSFNSSAKRISTCHRAN